MKKHFAIAVAVLAVATGTARESRALTTLTVQGARITDTQGKQVVLRGTNLGGWLLVEIWMMALDQSGGSTWIGDEKDLWDVLESRFGAAGRAQLQDIFRSHWIKAADIAHCAELGMNLVRVPINYRLLEDDDHPYTYRPEGFAILDNVLDWCEANGIYALLDLHGVQGGQSLEQHTGEEGRNLLWSRPDYQARAVALWAEIARHYRSRAVVAGYDLMNEPMGAPTTYALNSLYDRMYDAVRAQGDSHIIVMEDGYKGESALASPAAMGWQNVVFSFHYYPRGSQKRQRVRYHLKFDAARWAAVQRRFGVPILVGEFNAMDYSDEGFEQFARLMSAYNRRGWSWTTWSYKKISSGSGRSSLWGIFDHPEGAPWDKANPHTDSFAELARKFALYDTDNLTSEPRYRRLFLEADEKTPLSGVLWTATGPGQIFSTAREATVADRYRIGLLSARGPNLCNIRIYLDGKALASSLSPTSDSLSFFNEWWTTESVSLAAGPHAITVQTLAGGEGFGLDAIWLEPVRRFPATWQVAGPYGPGLSSPPPPDASWETVAADADGELNLERHFGRLEHRSAYARFALIAPEAQEATLLVGSDDRALIWLNGVLVYTNTTGRSAIADEDRQEVHLRKGRNEVVVLVENYIREWGLYLRFADPDGELEPVPFDWEPRTLARRSRFYR